jgi:hypothetical protein
MVFEYGHCIVMRALGMAFSKYFAFFSVHSLPVSLLRCVSFSALSAAYSRLGAAISHQLVYFGFFSILRFETSTHPLQGSSWSRQRVWKTGGLMTRSGGSGRRVGISFGFRKGFVYSRS